MLILVFFFLPSRQIERRISANALTEIRHFWQHPLFQFQPVLPDWIFPILPKIIKFDPVLVYRFLANALKEIRHFWRHQYLGLRNVIIVFFISIEFHTSLNLDFLLLLIFSVNAFSFSFLVLSNQKRIEKQTQQKYITQVCI